MNHAPILTPLTSADVSNQSYIFRILSDKHLMGNKTGDDLLPAANELVTAVVNVAVCKLDG